MTWYVRLTACLFLVGGKAIIGLLLTTRVFRKRVLCFIIDRQHGASMGVDNKGELRAPKYKFLNSYLL